MNNISNEQTQHLAEVFRHTYNPDKDSRDRATAQLSKYETEEKGFIPLLMQFTGQENVDRDTRLAAAIRFKNLVKKYWRWEAEMSENCHNCGDTTCNGHDANDTNDTNGTHENEENNEKKCNLSGNDKIQIKREILEYSLKQNDLKIRRQLYDSIGYILKQDFPHKWDTILKQVGDCFSHQSPQFIFGGANVLLQIYKKYEYYSRKHEDNPIEGIIDQTFPVLVNTCQELMRMYVEASKNNNNNSDSNMAMIMQILKPIFRIFHAALKDSFPNHLRTKDNYVAFLNLYINFLQIDAPRELTLEMGSNNYDMLYSFQEYSKYYTHPFVKTRKWVVRCVQRLIDLYGRPPYVQEDMREIAEFFLNTYAKQFMELIYFRVLQPYANNQFVYFKTLAPAIGYIDLSVHFSNLFKLLLDNDHKFLNELIFNCLFRIICLSPQDLSMWNDNPHEFVKQTFNLLDEVYDPRQQALRLIKSMVRVRTKYTFPKVLEFATRIISESQRMQAAYMQQMQHNNNNNINNNSSSNGNLANGHNGGGSGEVTEAQMKEMMIKKDGVLAILGTLSSVLEKAENGKYMNDMRALIMSNVIPDFGSRYGFLCARACWMVYNYYKLEYPEPKVYPAIAEGCIRCLKHPEMPVKIEASKAIARIILNDHILPFVKPSLPLILQEYLVLMDDIGLDAFVNIFSQLIDRLEGDIIPFAKDLLTKLLVSFEQLQQHMEAYMLQYPNEFESHWYDEKELQKLFASMTQNQAQQNMIDRVDSRTDEQQKEDYERFGEKCASAVQCLKTVHTVIFAASALPPLFAVLEEMVRPLIEQFFKKFFFYQHYIEEILETIQTLIHYSEPPSNYVWHLLEEVLQASTVFWPEKFNHTAQISCNYIEISKKYAVSLDSFMGIDMIDSMIAVAVTHLNDSNTDPLFLACMYDTLFSTYKEKTVVNMDKYVPMLLNLFAQILVEENSQQLRSAAVHCVSVMIYYDPKLFLNVCAQMDVQYFYSMVDRLCQLCGDCTWPAQRACIFGLSSIFAVAPSEIPQILRTPNYIEKVRKLLDVTTELVIAVNTNEASEAGDDVAVHEHCECDDCPDSKTNETEMDADDPNALANQEMKEAVESGLFGDDGKVLDLDADKDFINGRDVRYMRQCMDMEENPEFLELMMMQWDDSQTIPNTPLDSINEVMWFYECVGKLRNEHFNQVLQAWDQSLKHEDRMKLEKYLDDGKKGIEDMKQRMMEQEKEKAVRRNAAVEAAREAEARANQANQANQMNQMNGSNGAMNGGNHMNGGGNNQGMMMS